MGKRFILEYLINQNKGFLLINTEYISSGSYRLRVGSKPIGHNKYTGIRSNLRSETTPIHGSVNKFD